MIVKKVLVLVFPIILSLGVQNANATLECSDELLSSLRSTPTSHRKGLSNPLYSTHVQLFDRYTALQTQSEEKMNQARSPELQASAYSKDGLGQPQAMADRKIAQEKIRELQMSALRDLMKSISLMPCLKELERIGRL